MSSTKKKLRVFEAFAGIGAQATALKRSNIDHEIVGVSEWFIDAILAYDAIHFDGEPDIPLPSVEEQKKYLDKFTFSRDSVNPIPDITKYPEEMISKLYKANNRIKNLGSIIDIANSDMLDFPDTDLLVYSFPCQDLSTGGKTQGMAKGSGTRSGLLWEIEKILIKLKDMDRLPEFLLMENVRAILADSNKEDLDQWLKFLESIGYKNSDALLLSATDFGIPQNRRRAFIVSRLNEDVNISKEELIRKNKKPLNFLDFIKDDYSNPVYKLEADQAELYPTISRMDMWDKNKRENINEKTIINTITCNMDRSNTAAMFKYKGAKKSKFRLLTIREAFLLMGFDNIDYERAKSTGLSYRKLNKLIGNSIVVNVLEGLFKYLFEKEYPKD